MASHEDVTRSATPRAGCAAGRGELIAGWLIIIAAALYLAVGFTIGSTRDEEEYRISILTTVLHARALAQGYYPFWVSDLGLGMPHPLGQSFTLHPLMPLLAWMNPVGWSRLFYGLHVGVLVAGAIALGGAVGLSWLPTSVMTATFLLSTPAQNYVLTDFWPSGFFTWSMVPALLAAVIRLLGATGRAMRTSGALAVGLLAGLIAGNGHLGYVLMWMLPMLGFLGVNWRRVADGWRYWAIAAVAALLIASPAIVHLATETLRFPSGLPRQNYEDPLRWSGLWDLFVRPLPIGLSGDWAAAIASRGARVPFFGPPFAVLACLAVPFWRKWSIRTDVLAAFLVSAVLIAVPGLSRLRVFPATSLFRDPLILFGTVLAALALDRLRSPGRQWIGRAILLAQFAVLLAAAWPFVRLTLSTDPPPRPARAFVDASLAVESLREQVTRAPGRIYYSAAVDAQLNSGDLVRDSLWRNTAAFHRLSVLNGWFKGVSVDEVWPSSSFPYGNITADGALQQSQPTMGALGIRYLLAASGEAVAGGLRPVAALRLVSGREVILYQNPDVADAFFVEPERLATEAPVLPGCSHRALLCRDLSAVWQGRLPGSIEVDRRRGHILLRMSAAPVARTAVVSEMYRPGWTASGGAAVREAWSGLVAVEVPAGVETVEIRFRPFGRVLLVSASGLALVVTLAGLWIARARRRSGAGRSGGASRSA